MPGKFLTNLISAAVHQGRTQAPKALGPVLKNGSSFLDCIMVNKVVYTLFKVKDIEVDDTFIWKLETTDFISITNDINDEIRNLNKKKTIS